MSAIDEYVQRLKHAVPPVPIARQRLLVEVEDHLREAARDHGEEEAVARFGPPEHLARGFTAIWLRWAAGLVTVGLLAYPLLAYPVIESNLPPATWPEGAMPTSLEALRDAFVVLVLLAAGAALARRVSVVAGLAGAAAGVGIALQITWAHEVPGTPWWLAAVPAGQLVGAVLAGGLLARARALA